MLKLAIHLAVIVLLTVLTQLGGLAWIIALLFRRRILGFAMAYSALAVAALWIAPLTGRVPLPCLGGADLRVQTPLYCAMNRQYVSPELREVLQDHAAALAAKHPGTKTRVLDANFPFLTGFPLLPHLSHHDGRKVDLAFYYQQNGRYAPGKLRSPIGYFAFEQGPMTCPAVRPSLRWDMEWLQWIWPALDLDEARMRTSLQLLAADASVDKIFVEPHLKQRLGVASQKIRFQGCRAARHDDHIHLQL